ncbi:MAG: MATE family efflux transporter [Eggerthella lenta]
MLNGPLPGKILRFAIPLALSSILQQLLNSADASIAGQFVSSFSLAGIGGVNPVTAMFVNLFVGLSIGANVVVAMHVGAGEFHSIKKSVHTAMRSRSSPGGPGAGSPWPLGAGRHRHARRLPRRRAHLCAALPAPFRSSPSTTSVRRYCGPGDAKRPLMPSLPPLW